jgi:solute carrier family 25 iron transporter 28/37
VYRAEGLALSYAFYPTTLGIQFTVYKHIKKFANPRNEYSLQTRITAGGIAGGVAAPVITSLGVAKTILQTHGTSTEAERWGYDGCIRGHLDAGWD